MNSANVSAALAPNVTTETVKSGSANLSSNKVLILQRIYKISEEEKYDRQWLLIGLARIESVWMTVQKIFDTNNQYSIGLFHFQQPTFDRYCVKKYHVGTDIYDIDTQIKCVIKMDRDGLVPSNWVLSYKKIMSGK